MVRQASGASMSASANPPDCPVLCSPQSELNDGSLGIAAGVITKSGSTEATSGEPAAQPVTSATPAPGAVTAKNPSPSDSARQPAARPRSAAVVAVVWAIQASACTSTTRPFQSSCRVRPAGSAESMTRASSDSGAVGILRCPRTPAEEA